VFFWAGIYGIAVLAPQYLLEDRIGRDLPPPLNHPEYFYGFVGVALAWQLAFIGISRDVVRFRPLMLPAVADKLLFVASTAALYFAGRVAAPVVGAAAVDFLLGILFIVSYVRLAGREA
jgi:hypothetical protein